MSRALPVLSARTESAAGAAALFHALSDPTRVEILDRLRSGEKCVCELTDVLEAAQSRLSFHLRILREAGLVTDRKEGRWVYYTLVPESLESMSDALRALATPTSSTRSAWWACCQ